MQIIINTSFIDNIHYVNSKQIGCIERRFQANCSDNLNDVIQNAMPSLTVLCQIVVTLS